MKIGPLTRTITNFQKLGNEKVYVGNIVIHVIKIFVVRVQTLLSISLPHVVELELELETLFNLYFFVSHYFLSKSFTNI